MVIHLQERLIEEQARQERLLTKYSMLLERYKAIKRHRVEPDFVKKNFDIEPVSSPSEHVRPPKWGLFSRLRGNRMDKT
jgi:hypothetical protein